MTSRLLVLTERAQLPLGRSLRAVLAQSADAGLTHVVLRETDLADDQRAELARDLTCLGLAVIAAHRPLPGCVGVHLAARQEVGEAGGLPFGRSCHDAAAAGRAADEGAGWATLSPYSTTASKPGYGPPLATDAFRGHRIPIYALGGITPANARAAREAGAHGVAVMGAVMRARDPATVVTELLRELGR